MNGAERRRKSRQLEKLGLARITINLERVGDMLHQEHLIDPLCETDREAIARGIERLFELVDAARGDPDLRYVFSLFGDDPHNVRG